MNDLHNNGHHSVYNGGTIALPPNKSNQNKKKKEDKNYTTMGSAYDDEQAIVPLNLQEKEFLKNNRLATTQGRNGKNNEMENFANFDEI